MKKLAGRRPSPSLVISILALFVALASSAAALPGSNTVRSDDILNGQVKRPDVANNAVNSAKVAANALTGADVLESSLVLPAPPTTLPPNGPAAGDLAGSYPNPTIAGDAVESAEVALDSLTAADLAANSVGSSEVAADSLTEGDLGPGSAGSSEINLIIRQVGPVSLGAGLSGTVQAPCAMGEKATGGGGNNETNLGVNLIQSFPLPTDGASPTGWGATYHNTTGAPRNTYARAVCLAP